MALPILQPRIESVDMTTNPPVLNLDEFWQIQPIPGLPELMGNRARATRSPLEPDRNHEQLVTPLAMLHHGPMVGTVRRFITRGQS